MPLESVRSQMSWRIKYSIEWALSALALCLVFPILVTIGILVKITSEGPILYVSERIGRHGRIFRLYKYRTMGANAPSILGADKKVLTIKNDSRVTALGRILRLGFDELPQLFNIIKGDMCLIGPRPDVLWAINDYTERQKIRLSVLPGISGLAAVAGGRDLPNEWNYEMDARYVESSSWRTDIKIMLLTVPYALGRDGIAARWLGNFLEGMNSESNKTES